MITAISLMYRFMRENNLKLHFNSVRPLYIVSVFIAQKILLDNTITAKTYSKFFRIYDTQDIINMEREFLEGINFRTYINRQLFLKFKFMIMSLNNIIRKK
jgi:hypothetical protein